jgi:hypothetical protein
VHAGERKAWHIVAGRGAEIVDGALYLMLRAAFITCTYGEVLDRAYAPRPPPPLAHAPVTQKEIERARSLFEDGFRRRDTVASKVTALLTIAGVVIPLTVGLAAVVSEPWLLGIALVPLTWSALLLVSCLGVERISTLSFVSSTGNPAEDERALVADYLTASSMNEGAVDFVVDVYRGALRSFVVASLALITVALLSFERQVDPIDALMSRISSDGALLASLRGPPGERGEKGPPSPPGPACDWIPLSPQPPPNH